MLNVSKGKKWGPHCADSAAMRCCTHLNLGQRWRQRSTGFHQGGLIWAFAQEFHPPCLQVIDATLDLHFTRSNLPNCVCAPCSHRDSFELFFISRGAMNTLEGIAQRRPFHRVVIFLRDASGTYLQQFLKFAAVTHGTPSLRPDRRPRPCALGLLSF